MQAMTSVKYLLSLFVLLVNPKMTISAEKPDDFTLKRRRMVTQQIISRGIKDPRVLEAMNRVPRHLFVPKSHRSMSYADSPLPIGEGQTISQPFIVAFMTESLYLKPEDRVREIGPGSA